MIVNTISSSNNNRHHRGDPIILGIGIPFLMRILMHTSMMMTVMIRMVTMVIIVVALRQPASTTTILPIVESVNR
jgi:hypothetical protein